jgi:ferrous iron transport protein A
MKGIYMTLRKVTIGQQCRVGKISLRHDTARRLEMLGLTMGTKIMLLNKNGNGAVIVKVRGTRFAFGREIAEGIEVTNGEH